MTEHFINLNDGSRLEVKVNFGTLYYMQKQKGFYRIAKKAESEREKLTESESMEFTANIIYALLRSNGRMVTFDEAICLMPADMETLKDVMDDFQKEYDRYSKKKESKRMTVPKK